MTDEQTINRLLRDARDRLGQVEMRISLDRMRGDEASAQRWDEQHGRHLRNQIEVYETQLAVWRGDQPAGAVLDVYRRQMAAERGEGGSDDQ